MANEGNLGANFSIDVTNLKTGLSQANRLIRESESEFKAAAAGMDDWSTSQDGVSAKIKSLNSITDIQKKKVDALQQEYDNLIANGLDPTSAQAVELRTKINNETTALNKNEAELKKQTKALEELEKGTDEAADAAGDMGDKFGGLKAAGGLAVGAIAAVGAAAAGAVTAFLGLAESTREARTNMARLETSFASAGLSAEAAENTFTELYGILGDDGAATEAAQQLAKISKDEADLAANTRILTGVMAEYGASIPTEGLAEGMAATAAMGEVQGVLADALEWQGVNLDDYNAELAKLTTEEERAAYIQQTLTDLYGESADAYRENNAEVIEAQKAQAELNNAINELGAIAEPIMTTIKTLAAGLLTSITPFVKLIGEGLTGALNGSSDAAALFSEGLTGIVSTIVEKLTGLLPTVLEMITTLIPQILTALLAQLPTILETLISMVTQIITALSEMLPTIVAAIMEVLPQLINSLIAAIPQLLEAAVTLLMAIVEAIPIIITALVEALPSIIETLIAALIDAIPLLLDAAIQLLNAIIEAIPTIIEALIENLPSIINTIINGVVEALPLLLEASINLFFALIDAIPVIVEELVKNLPQIITTIITALVDAFPKLLSTAGELFGQLLTAAWDLIKKLPEVLGKIISSIVDFLVKPFGDMFGKMWDGLKNGAKKAWDGVKEIFGKVAGFFGDVFGKAWDGVKKIFSTGGKIFDGIKDGIVSAFKSVVNAIIKGINKVVRIPFDAINGILNGIRSIDVLGVKPFSGLWKKNPLAVPQIPLLATGAIVDKATPAIVGEDGAEAIIPLERNREWIRKVAKEFLKTSNENAKRNVTVNQTNYYAQTHSRYELYKTKQQTAAAVRLALGKA